MNIIKVNLQIKYLKQERQKQNSKLKPLKKLVRKTEIKDSKQELMVDITSSQEPKNLSIHVSNK
jgi:hypothetical protein